MNGVTLTCFTRDGLREYTYELGGINAGQKLSNIISDTNDLLDARFGERIVSVWVD